MRLLLVALVVPFSLLMTACATQAPKEIVVTQTKQILKVPPESLMQDCKITAPPDKQEYIQAKRSEREDMMFQYADSLLADLGNCNTDKKALRNWAAEQKKLFD